MLLQMMGGGGEQAPAPAPEAQPEGEPVYRMGGRLVRRIRG